METILLKAEEMRKRLGVSKDTFRQIWRRWKYERVGAGHDLRSMRFYWQDGPLANENYENGSEEISNQKRNPVRSRGVSRRYSDKLPSRIHVEACRSGVGKDREELDDAARRFGFIA